MLTLAGKTISQDGLGLMREQFALERSSQFALPDVDIFKVLKAALAVGTNLWNGADHYCKPDSNSLHLMNRYFIAYPEDADKVVSTLKIGIVDRQTLGKDCSPAGLRKSCENALRILDGKKET